jgi:hypothetical protein
VRSGGSLALAVAIGAGLVVASSPGHARPTPTQELSEFLGRAEAELKTLVKRRLKPTKRHVTWKARLLAKVSLGVPVIAHGVADVDGNGRDNLIVATSEELLIVEVGRKAKIISRAPLPVRPPAKLPRRHIGVVYAYRNDSGLRIRVRTSAQSVAAVFGWRENKLEFLRSEGAYPVCTASSIERSPGRNYFASEALKWSTKDHTVPTGPRLWTLGCTGSWPTARGNVVQSFSTLSDSGELTIHRRSLCLEPKDCNAALQPLVTTSVGTSFAVDDIDGDGEAEVIVASDRPSARPDQLLVYVQKGGKLSPVFEQNLAGTVEVVAVGNFLGKGKRAIAAVRLRGNEGRTLQLWGLD